MNDLIEGIFSNSIIPSQFWTIIFGTIITIVFISYTFYKIRTQSPQKAPKGLALLTITYVNWFNRFMGGALGGKLRHTYSYLFTLFNYVLIMGLLSLVGFSPAPSAYFFPFVLALISFIGIYVVGIGTKGLWFFLKEKYANPIEIFSQIAPLLSLSLRLFGATLAGAVIGQIFSIILTSLSTAVWINYWPLVDNLFMWTWKIIESFLTFIQAFVFMFLTAMYWLMEYGVSFKRAERVAYYKNEKELKIKERQIKLEQEKNNFNARQ